MVFCPDMVVLASDLVILIHMVDLLSTLTRRTNHMIIGCRFMAAKQC